MKDQSKWTEFEKCIWQAASAAARETESFTYADWYNHTDAHRGERVHKAALLGRELTEEERTEWQKSHGTERELAHIAKTEHCNACIRFSCKDPEHELQPEEWMKK